MMFMDLLSVNLFSLAIAIFKNAVEGRDVKFELAVELVLIVIYFILYQIVFNWDKKLWIKLKPFIARYDSC